MKRRSFLGKSAAATAAIVAAPFAVVQALEVPKPNPSFDALVREALANHRNQLTDGIFKRYPLEGWVRTSEFNKCGPHKRVDGMRLLVDEPLDMDPNGSITGCHIEHAPGYKGYLCTVKDGKFVHTPNPPLPPRWAA